MANEQLNFAEVIKAIKRRKIPALAVFVLVAAAFLAYAALAPATYRSNATILIEQQEIPQEMVRSTVTSFADQRIQMIIQRVMTFGKLSDIIKKYDLYQKLRTREPLEYVVEKMKDDIDHQTISAEVVDPRSGRPIEATIAFTIAYSSTDPRTAQTVANELTNLFLNENLKTRDEMAREAEEFLTAEVEALERKSSELEQALATFKESNFRKLPEHNGMNLSILDRAETEYMDLTRQIQSLEERKIYLEGELNQQSPNANFINGASESSLSPQARARLLQNRYLELSATYSANHPDVIKARRELDKVVGSADVPADVSVLRKQLEIYRAELTELRARYDEQHPDVQAQLKKIARFEKLVASARPQVRNSGTGSEADNPAYIQLSAMLESARVDLQHLRETRTKVKAKIDTLEAALIQSPEVEKQFRELSRDYDNTTQKYRELKEKQLEASMARALEKERKGERFTLIEPPLQPEKPVKPNRILIAVAGLIVAILAAGGFVVLLENVDQTFRTAADLKGFLGQPPLAVIPHIVTAEERVVRRRLATAASVGVVMVVVLGVVAVHLLIVPIDVLWYMALRKIA